MSDEKHLTNQRFTELPLAPQLQAAVADTGFEWLTPIQAEALPVLLGGEDVAGQAQTGTGKTACFLLALFDYLLRTPASVEREPTQLRAVVLAPTRELAIQIHRDAEPMAEATGFRLALAYGGTGYEQQRRTLQEGADVLIGTPGRIIDYYKQKVFGLGAVQVMVLDEADRMFDLGFIKDIRFLLRRMPPPEQRLNMLFSATLSHRVNELAYDHMNNARVVRIDIDQVTVANIKERVFFPGNDDKIPLLAGLLRQLESPRAMVFVNTKHMAERLENWLGANGLACAVLSGDVPQLKREKLLQAFKNGEMSILVATDVAARGLHINDVTHVFNFDLPQDAEDYVHRIGRTARAGASGEAISFACESYAESLPDIEAYIGHRIPTEAIEPALLAELDRPARSASSAGRERPTRDSRGGGRRAGSDGRSSSRSTNSRSRRSEPVVTATVTPAEDMVAPTAAAPVAVSDSIPETSAAPVAYADTTAVDQPQRDEAVVADADPQVEAAGQAVADDSTNENGDAAPKRRRRRRRRSSAARTDDGSTTEPEAPAGVEAEEATPPDGDGGRQSEPRGRSRGSRPSPARSNEESANASDAAATSDAPSQDSDGRGRTSPAPSRPRRRFTETPAIG